MKCPKCSVTLLMTEKKDIEIDYCPECRGIWLDRGELEKLIERSVGESSYDSYNKDNDNHYKHDDDHHEQYNHSNNKYGYKRKKGFLSEIFDF